MKSYLLKTSLLTTIFLFIFCSFTHATVGKIVALRGKAWVERDSNKINLKVNTPILKKDSIHTGKRSRLQVMFNDETIASLGPESVMKVNDYEWDEKNGKFNTEAKQGIFHILGGKIVNSSPDNFKIETPLASIGIRGSMFAFSVNKKEVNVVFLGGKGIDISSKFGSVALLKPGFGTKVSGEKKKIEKPRQYTPAEMKEFKDSKEPDKDKEDKKDDKKDKPKEKTIKKPEDQKTSDSNEEREEILSVKGQISSIDDIEENINENILPGFPSGGIPEESKYSNNEDLNISKSIKEVSYLGSSYKLEHFKITTDKNEFIIEHTPTAVILNNNNFYFYSDTVFTGNISASSAFATTGKDIYFGVGTQSFESNNASLELNELSAGELFFTVNNENQRAAGIFIPDTFMLSPDYNSDDHPVLFFGTRNNSTNKIEDLSLISYKHMPDETGQNPMDLKVSVNSYEGKFYGSSAQGFGINVNGFIKDISDETTVGNFALTAGSFDTDGININLKNTTSSSWSGFAAAFGETKTISSYNKDVFLSKNYEDFSLSFDRQNGTFTGNLNLKGQNSSESISGIYAGGDKTNSAYIDDKFFIGKLSPSSDQTGSKSGYMITSPDQNFYYNDNAKNYEYISWGYWNLNYGSNNQDQTNEEGFILPGGSLWIAGEPTSQAVISQLNTQKVTLNYSGNVLSSKVNDSHYITHVEGNFSLAADFNSLNISGTLSPDMKSNLTFNGNIESSGLFNTTLNNSANTAAGNINGGFFGPNANTTAGNFNALIDNDKFFGIFAGDKN